MWHCQAGATTVIAWRLWLSAILSISVACSIDYFPSRVGAANQSVVRFLISYRSSQAAFAATVGHFDAELKPSGQGRHWASLSSEYQAVLARQYSCQFQIERTRFNVTCFPQRSTGLLISFYQDQSGTIRIAGQGQAGPESPELRLTSKEKIQLFGDDHPKQ